MDNLQYGKLTYDSVLDLKRMLQDKSVIQLMLLEEGKTVARVCDIDPLTGVITLGKYSYRWLNKLFGQEYKMSFLDFSEKVIDLLCCNPGDSLENKRQKKEGATKDFFEAIFIEKDYNLMVRNLFIFFYLGFKNPELSKDCSKTPLDLVSFEPKQKNAVINIHGAFIKDGFGRAVFLGSDGVAYKIIND